MVGYAKPDWQSEPQVFVAWRDACWRAALAMMEDALATGNMPSVNDAMAALPEWPH